MYRSPVEHGAELRLHPRAEGGQDRRGRLPLAAARAPPGGRVREAVSRVARSHNTLVNTEVTTIGSQRADQCVSWVLQALKILVTLQTSHGLAQRLRSRENHLLPHASAQAQHADDERRGPNQS